MKTWIAFLFLLPAASFAQGDHSGGGGDIFICPKKVDQKGFFNQIFGRKTRADYYLLDVYEALKTSSRKLDLGGPNLSVYEKIELVRRDFSKLDPIRADQYAREATKMARDLDANANGISTYDRIELVRQDLALDDPQLAERYVADEMRKVRETLAKKGKLEQERTVFGLASVLNTRLVDIQDADDVYVFMECNRKQLVRQEVPTEKTIGSPIYQFDAKYWQKLDVDNQVATFFHEAIYKEFRFYGASVSRPSRALNSYLFSRSADSLSLIDYLAFLATHGATEYYFLSNVGKVRLFKYYENRWSALVTGDGLITNVSAGYANLNLGAVDSRFNRLPLSKVTTYSFNRERQLTAINGAFSISYDSRLKKIRDFNANCFTSAYPCLSGTSISIGLNGKLQLDSGAQKLTFDLDGNLLGI